MVCIKEVCFICGDFLPGLSPEERQLPSSCLSIGA